MEALWPAAHLVPEAFRTALRGLGGLVFLVGVAGFAWMVATMRKIRTPIHNSSTPTVLVDGGPFRLTRNPMYLFGSVAYAGLALLLLEPWPLVFLPIVVFVTHYGVVLREEAFLERLFGEPYKRYQTRVRRYL